MSDKTHQMVLENLAIPTGVISPGARVRDFLAECIRCKGGQPVECHML